MFDNKYVSGFLATSRCSTKESGSSARDEQHEGQEALFGDAWVGEVIKHDDGPHGNDHTYHIREETRFALEGRLTFAHLTDSTWRSIKWKVVKLMMVPMMMVMRLT